MLSQRQRRRRRGALTAGGLAAAILASGLIYAGLHDDPAQSAAAPARPAKAAPRTVDEAVAAASRTGKSVEVTALRAPTSTTWARPDHLMERRITPVPVRVFKDGEWRQIDATLTRTKSGWETKSTSARIWFSPGGRGEDKRSSRSVRRVSLLQQAAAADAELQTPLASLDVGDHTVQLTWPGAVPAPIVDGSRILYPEILPGADLVLTADDGGFAQLLVVKNRQAASDARVRQLSYGLTSSTLVFRIDPLSDIVSAEDKNGDEVAFSPSPVMWDNAGMPAVTDGQVGASAQPSTAESLPPASSETPEESTTGTPEEETEVETDEQTDTNPEVLPSSSEEPAPSLSEAPLPSVPAEPTAAPSQSGSAATLGLPSLDGPGPDSHGSLVDADLVGDQWLINPDADFLDADDTVYPVFIDPSISKQLKSWTTAYSRFPKSTFYNGRNFNKGGTHEARVGFESDTWGTSRSFFNMDFGSDLKGVKMEDATLRLLETYSWSCSARSMSVHVTGKIGSKTNWSNAPKLHDGNKITSRSFAHGYKSGCGDAYETFKVTKQAQAAAEGGKDIITFGLRATDEKSQYAWKKFRANGNDGIPILKLTYNRKPSAPTGLDLSPDSKCTTTEPYVRMGAEDITFTASAADKDGNLDYLDFDLWPTGKWDTTKDLLKTTGQANLSGSSAKATTAKFPTSKLTNNTLYSWRVRAVDDRKATSSYSPSKTPCRFILDTKAPKAPQVTSTDFPDADPSDNGFGNGNEDAAWSTKKFGTAGSFTFRALNTDVVKYEYSFNGGNYNFSRTRTAGTATSVKLTITDAKPPTAGPNVLFVRTVDGAGNVSQPTKYYFYVSPRDEADAPGDFTGDKLPDLMVVTEAGNLALYPSQGKATDVTKGSGDLDYSMSGAYRANPSKDPAGDDLPPYVSASGHFKGNALITHNGDIYGGDGLQDLVARVGGKLWVYPGDGYGAVNTDKRREILLLSNAPDPATLTQIVAAGDITGDGKTDFFATVGDALWALTGYNGAAISTATRLTSSPWLDRDIVMVQDVNGDGAADLVFRDDSTQKLHLRLGKKAASGGTDINSLAVAANSVTGVDDPYNGGGWSRASIPFVIGTPDANGDGIPDVWTVRSDGSVRFYAGDRTVLPGAGTTMITANDAWRKRIAVG